MAVKHPAGSTGFHWSWLNPFSIGGYRRLSAGLVLGVFFFWGWDTATNLNEESKNATKTPGQAGIISMFLLLLVFGINIIAAQMLLPGQGLERPPVHHPLVLRPAGRRALGRLRDDHRRAVLDGGHHPDHLAPGGPHHPVHGPGPGLPQRVRHHPGQAQDAGGGHADPGLRLAVRASCWSATSSSVNTVFDNLISNIGVLIAFYYGVTGLTCAWAYRKVAFQRRASSSPGSSCPCSAGSSCCSSAAR